jgi:hypothetical protein
MIVEVVPPVAVSDAAAIVLPVDHVPATPDAPTPKVPAKAGLANVSHPSSLGRYKYAVVLLVTKSWYCL